MAAPSSHQVSSRLRTSATAASPRVGERAPCDAVRGSGWHLLTYKVQPTPGPTCDLSYHAAERPFQPSIPRPILTKLGCKSSFCATEVDIFLLVLLVGFGFHRAAGSGCRFPSTEVSLGCMVRNRRRRWQAV